MFIVCKACDGSGEGVYGHSWTTCPVCNGAGQVVMEVPQVPYFEAPVMKTVVVPEAKAPVRCGRNSLSGVHADTDPMGVFPDPTYKRREPIAA